MELWIRIAMYSIGFILLFSLFEFVLLLHPPRYSFPDTPEDHGMEYENVSFDTYDDLTLDAWFIPAEKETNKTIIVGHGYPFNKGNIVPIVEFLNSDYNMLMYDFRSFGKSEGFLSTAGLREEKDVDSAVEFLKDRNKDESIGLYGFSLSASAFLMNDNENVKAIVADSPYARGDLLLNKIYFFFPGPLKKPFIWTSSLYSKIFFNKWPSEVGPLNNIGSREADILLIHGTEDSEIPVDHSKLLFERANKDKTQIWLVEGSDHGQAYSLKKEEYEKKVLEFFDDTL